MAKPTIGGKEVEVFSEAFFCIYFALHIKKKLNDYKATDWLSIKNAQDMTKWARKKTILPIIKKELNDHEFTSRIKLISTFLIDKEWDERLRKQIVKFTATIPVGGTSKSYEAMRADVMPSLIDPYILFDKLAQQIKTNYNFRTAVDKDKWNPADVWIFSSTGRNQMSSTLKKLNAAQTTPTPYKVGAVNELNNLIRSLYDSKDVYPISLKAPGQSVHISLENDKESGFVREVRYVKSELGLNNMDLKIHFAIDLYNPKTKRLTHKDVVEGRIKTKTDKGGFRMEIEVPGSGARYGSIGTENYQWIIYNTDNSGVRKLNRIRNDYDDPEDYFPAGGERTWLGASNYQKKFKQDPTNMEYLDDYFQELFKTVNKNNQPFPLLDPRTRLSKVVAAEIGVAMEFITNSIMRDITVENLYNLSASQSFSAGITPAQLERKRNILGSSKKLEALGEKEAQHIMDSCFHLKVY